MIFLISPTKTQKENASLFYQEPHFHQTAMTLHEIIASWSLDEIITNYKISEKLAQSVKNHNHSFSESNTAIHTYQGSSFKNMERDTWTEKDLSFAEDHLRILSALYGVLKPRDTIGLYRLDFLTQHPLNLIKLWKKEITPHFNTLGKTIINLASQEYSDMIDLDSLTVPLITISFEEFVNGKYVVKSTYAKIARGVMIKELVKNRITDIDALKKVSVLDYIFDINRSTDTHYIFSR